ncbi:MAG TPA: hypothetical protein VKF42_00070 [Chitinivibrionales bacterium]|jgi:hypothetical protein|nr:hypothetical protein [Chitinivibrionales bacterium]
MNISAFRAIAVCMALFPAASLAAEAGAPVQIEPTIQDYAKLFTQKLSKKFFVGDVVDKRQNAGSDSVGATRTGRFEMSPLLCKPLPSAILQQSLAGMLRELGALAEDRNSADFLVDAELLEYGLEETNKVFSQQIKATLKFRVMIKTTESGALVNQFVIRAEDSRSAIDTTPFAVKVAANAMASGLQNLLESLAAL